MTLSDWVRTSVEACRKTDIVTGTKLGVNELYIGALRRAGRVWNYGTPIYERDWDVLVLLDACRPDAIAAVADEYEFLPESVPTHVSLGSQSLEWMEKNFTSEYRTEQSETAYVSSNIFTRELDDESFEFLDEVWRYGWDDDCGTIPPRPVTDRAVAVARDRRPERLIVHYMQPHEPYRSMGSGGSIERTLEHDLLPDGPIHRLQRGELPFEAVWDAYVDNLRWVLDDVELLLENVDAETVAISADHGEAFGEWWCYEHPEYAPVPVLKRVPWIETAATDKRTHEPTRTPEQASLDDGEIADRLHDLGYL